MTQAHATNWEKLKKCGFEGMSQFLSDFLHEPNPCVLSSGQRTLVAPKAHGGGLVHKSPSQKNFYILVDCGSKFLPEPIFSFKNSWLSLTNFSC